MSNVSLELEDISDDDAHFLAPSNNSRQCQLGPTEVLIRVVYNATKSALFRLSIVS